ncbi:MAG TPA: hypothetical protein P5081_23715 [Phycisphaerae bacterium]|nr:hypothetical protein [Phycisphaerae bacterium]HRW55892.1 hypothetical protein [Phycisphaerae bacterium]
MQSLSIIAAMLLITTGAPGQDASKSGAGQMREVSGSTNQGQVNPPEKSTTTTQTPISANQSAKGEDANAGKSADDSKAASTAPRQSPGDGPGPRRLQSGADVLERLRDRQRTAPVIPPARPGVKRVERTAIAEGAIPDNALRPVDRKLLPDGSRIVDRAGRLTRDGDYLTFTFESRGEGPIEVPLRLLPNRLLEDMEQISEGGRKSVVFVVSGDITEYRGVNYLLLQKLLIRPDLGNLR